MSKKKKKRKCCKKWCRSVAHGRRGYCTKKCRDRAEKNGTIEGRPGKILFVAGVRVPDWFPLFEDLGEQDEQRRQDPRHRERAS